MINLVNSMDLKFFVCRHCGNVIAYVKSSGVKVVCCGEPMQLLAENSVDAAKEKHVPVLEKVEGGYKVTVGSALHAMTEEHYIEWIELIADGVSYKKFLKPGDEPVAEFCLEAETVYAREYCNLHGLYKSL